MSMKPGSSMKRLMFILGLGVFFLTATYFLYPRIIAELYGKTIPLQWSLNFGGMTFSQIYQKLGSPQEDASAKDYQQWVELHWWGAKTLKLISADCCKPNSQPSAVIYVVYVNGWYDPVHRKTITNSGDQ